MFFVLCSFAGCSGNATHEKWRYERVLWEDRPEIRSAADAAARAREVAARRSITLDDAYRLALHRSETLAMTGEELVRIQTQYEQAIAAVLPSVKFKGSYLRQTELDDATSFTLPERREYKFTLHQPIFSGLRDIFALRQADAFRDAMTLDLRHARLLLFGDVALAFYAVQLAKRDLATTETSLRLARERLEELVQRNRAGFARRSEVLAQEAEVAVTDARVQTLRGVLEIAWRTFEFLTGLAERPELADTLPDPDATAPVETWIRRALAARDDVASLERQVDASEDNVSVAQGGYLPIVSLDGNYYTHRDGFSGGIDWDVTLSLEVPLFDGFATYAKIREAESSVRTARLKRELLLRQIALDVQKAHADVRSLLASRRSLDRAVASARENYALVEAEYRQNIVTNLEVLQVFNTLQSVLLGRHRADAELRLASVRLWIASGRLPEDR